MRATDFIDRFRDYSRSIAYTKTIQSFFSTLPDRFLLLDEVTRKFDSMKNKTGAFPKVLTMIEEFEYRDVVIENDVSLPNPRVRREDNPVVIEFLRENQKENDPGIKSALHILMQELAVANAIDLDLFLEERQKSIGAQNHIFRYIEKFLLYIHGRIGTSSESDVNLRKEKVMNMIDQCIDFRSRRWPENSINLPRPKLSEKEIKQVLTHLHIRDAAIISLVRRGAKEHELMTMTVSDVSKLEDDPYIAQYLRYQNHRSTREPLFTRLKRSDIQVLCATLRKKLKMEDVTLSTIREIF